MKLRHLQPANLTLLCALLFGGCSNPILEKRGELCSYVPANRQPEPGAKVKGKIAVAYVGSTFNPRTNNGCIIDGYSGGYTVDTNYFPESMYAATPDEIETLILISQKKGKFIRTVDLKMTQSVGWLTDVYAGQIEISLIDYRSSTLLGSSIRTFAKMPDRVDRDDLTFSAQGDPQKAEYVISPTRVEIREALREFSSDVKND